MKKKIIEVENVFSEDFFLQGNSPGEFRRDAEYLRAHTSMDVMEIERYNALIIRQELKEAGRAFICGDMIDPCHYWQGTSILKRAVKIPRDPLDRIYGKEVVDSFVKSGFCMIKKGEMDIESLMFFREDVDTAISKKSVNISYKGIPSMTKRILFMETMRLRDIVLLCRKKGKNKRAIAICDAYPGPDPDEYLILHSTLEKLTDSFVGMKLSYIIMQDKMVYRLHLSQTGRKLSSEYGLDREYTPVLEITCSDSGAVPMKCNICITDGDIFFNIPQLKCKLEAERRYEGDEDCLEDFLKDALSKVCQTEAFYRKMKEGESIPCMDGEEGIMDAVNPIRTEIDREMRANDMLLFDIKVHTGMLGSVRKSELAGCSRSDMIRSALDITKGYADWTTDNPKAEKLRDCVGKWVLEE